MKLNKTILAMMILPAALFLASCDKDDDDDMDNFDTSGTYTQKDQMARPGIATVFIAADKKDLFNMTTPSAMSAAFKTEITNKLTAFGFMTNALGQTKDQFAGLLATDVLNVKLNGTTTFFDGTNVLALLVFEHGVCTVGGIRCVQAQQC